MYDFSLYCCYNYPQDCLSLRCPKGDREADVFNCFYDRLIERSRDRFVIDASLAVMAVVIGFGTTSIGIYITIGIVLPAMLLLIKYPLEGMSLLVAIGAVVAVAATGTPCPPFYYFQSISEILSFKCGTCSVGLLVGILLVPITGIPAEEAA